MRLKIICIGNALHGNDGIGHAVYRALRQLTLPDSVEIIDGGIGGFTLIPLFNNCERVLLIDAVADSEHAIRDDVFVIENACHYLNRTSQITSEHGGDIHSLLTLMPVYINPPPRVDLLCIVMPAAHYFKYTDVSLFSDCVEQVCKRVFRYLIQVTEPGYSAMKKENSR